MKPVTVVGTNISNLRFDWGYTLNIKEFENTSALDIALADEVAMYLKQSIDQQGSASLVVSGGRTPLGFFHTLSQQSLDW